MYEINETHDPNLKSWVESANDPDTDFPIQNLPFCNFRHKSNESGSRIGVRIGDQVVDLEELSVQREFQWWLKSASGPWRLDTLARIRPESAAEIRTYLTTLLRDDADESSRTALEQALIPALDVEFFVPFKVGDYTDFYCSIFHATNVGSMFRRFVSIFAFVAINGCAFIAVQPGPISPKSD